MCDDHLLIKQKSLQEHFLRDGHHHHQSFQEDLNISLINKTDSFDPRKSECYWMGTLKTIAPFGLNTEETY